jgi:NADH dehydrogenase
MGTDRDMPPNRPKVVVLGAGFAGLAAAKTLANEPVDVEIVDRRNYHTFSPLLYQVATAGLNPADVAYPVRAIFRKAPNIDFHQGTVSSVEPDHRIVCLDDGTSIPYDYCIVGLGATTNFFGVRGAEKFAFPLYRLGGAVHLRNQIMSRFEAADANPATIADGALTFVIVGGGPTGVEMAGAMMEILQSVLFKDYPHIDRSVPKVVLVEMLDVVLSAFNERSQRHAYEALIARGVEIRTKTQVEEITADCVRFASGEELPTQTVVWAAGVSAHQVGEVIRDATFARAGRVVVEPDLSLRGHSEVFVAGDLAADGHPQLAPVAIQGGTHAAKQILRDIAGRGRASFHYRSRGIMATIGRRAAVAELPLGISLSGTFAWLAWLVLHLAWLIGFRNRLSVLVNWGWNYVAWERGPRIIVDIDDPHRMM